MKNIQIIVAILGIVAVSAQSSATVYTIPDVYSTGVDNSGNALSVGAVDPHYTVASSLLSSSTLKISGTAGGSWMPDSSTSRWINPSGNTHDLFQNGTYVYNLVFSLSGFDPATAAITGEWASDNGSSIYLNGVFTGYTHTLGDEFTSFNSFTLTNNFVAGLNTVSFVVTNGPWFVDNPTGLRVQISSATAVPEPGSLSFFTLGAIGLWIGRKAQRR